MGVPKSEIGIYTSEIISNTPANGGRAGNALVSGGMNNFFDVVFEEDRIAGITRYRKGFLRNKSTLNDMMHVPKIYMSNPTFAGDYYQLALGTPENTQADVEASEPLWVGTGSLVDPLVGGETSLDVTMEADTFNWLPGEQVFIANRYMKGQTKAADVRVGDSVENTEADPANMDIGTWEKVAFSEEFLYPYGRYTGNSVITITPTQSKELAIIKDTQIAGEDIGTGDGISSSPTLTALADAATGLLGNNYRPVITTLSGAAEKTITVGDDGICTGDCSAGELNMADGTWVVNPVWTSAPDAGEDILISYARKPFVYAGNVATIELEYGVQNAYPVAADTHVSHCVMQTEIIPSWSDYSDTAVSGSYDVAGFPPELTCKGTVTDTFHFDFTNGTNFTCTGVKSGLIGSGTITADFEPINTAEGAAYLALRLGGWTGSFSAGDRVTIKTWQASMPFWLKEIVPPGSNFTENNTTEICWLYQ